MLKELRKVTEEKELRKKLLKVIYKEVKKSLFTCKQMRQNNVFGVDLWA